MKKDPSINLLILKKRRQTLRRVSPSPERILWSHLRKSKLKEAKFRRQTSIGPYVVDFYCPRHKLVIEIDGTSHLGSRAKKADSKRDGHLGDLGIQVLRFTNEEVLNDTDFVLKKIGEVIS